MLVICWYACISFFALDLLYLRTMCYLCFNPEFLKELTWDCYSSHHWAIRLYMSSTHMTHHQGRAIVVVHEGATYGCPDRIVELHSSILSSPLLFSFTYLPMTSKAPPGLQARELLLARPDFVLMCVQSIIIFPACIACHWLV